MECIRIIYSNGVTEYEEFSLVRYDELTEDVNRDKNIYFIRYILGLDVYCYLLDE